MNEELSVLLVEDDAADRALFKRAVRGAPVDLLVTEASTLCAARGCLQSTQFDVQVVDLRLPDGNGLDLIEVAGPNGRLVPCVILTGSADPEFGFTALERGAQDYVQKGEPSHDLVRAIRFAIQRSRATLAPERSQRCMLSAAVRGGTRGEATVRDPATGTSHQIRSDNRAVLLYLLGRKLLEDRAAGVPELEAGWMSDREVVIGIWGRGGELAGRNRLHVLVHRMRKELLDVGIQCEVVETRRNALRGRFSGVELDVST